MRRRLTIARSLINEPEILLLDEPTTGLDPQARHVLWDRLFRLKQQGVTLILTTHYMDEAEQLCDRLVVMDHGKIVAEGLADGAHPRACDPGGAGLRFAIGEQDAARRRSARASRRPDRATARPVALVRRRRRGGPAPGAPARSDPGHRAGTTGHFGGRVPGADRPDPGRLTMTYAKREFEYRLRQYRRTWKGTVVISIANPLLFLIAIGPGWAN